MAKKNTQKTDSNEMSFLGHLEELRWHIIRAAIAVVVLMIVSFINREFIFTDIILKPKSPEFITNQLFGQLSAWINNLLGIESNALAINSANLDIVNIEMAGQFISHIKVSLITGAIVASPYIFWEVWRFIKPALQEKEKSHARGAVFYTSFLFIIGILFGYYIITPLSINFLATYNVSGEVVNTIKLNSYIGTVTSVTFAAGIVFLLPIAVLFLSKTGLLTPVFMKKYRKHAYVLFLVLSAIITPPDVFSQILVCIPLIFLYEISILISRSVNKKRDKRLADEDKNPIKTKKEPETISHKPNIDNDVEYERTFLDGSEDEPKYDE